MLWALHKRQRLHLKQEDNHVRSKDKQGVVLTGSSEDILFLFNRLTAKSTPLIFNENYDSTNFNADKTKHTVIYNQVYNQVPGYSQTQRWPTCYGSERTLQGNVSHLKAILMLGEGCMASPFPRSSIDDHLAMQLGWRAVFCTYPVSFKVHSQSQLRSITTQNLKLHPDATPP